MSRCDFTVSVPVEPYVHNFLLSNFGENYRAQLHDPLTNIILSCTPIEGNNMTYINNDSKEFNITFPAEFYRHYIKLEDRKRLRTFGFSDNAIAIFHKTVLKYMMQKAFNAMLLNKIYHNIKYSQTLRGFRRTYGISEDDISLDVFKVEFNRYQLKNKENSYVL